MIDRHSTTWTAVQKFIEEETSSALELLVADKDSDKQRGVILVLEKLNQLNKEQPTRIVTDNYS